MRIIQAEVLSRVLGRAVRFVEQPVEELRSFSAEMADMFQWFNEYGYQADIATLRTLHPQLMTLEKWLLKTGWDQL